MNIPKRVLGVIFKTFVHDKNVWDADKKLFFEPSKSDNCTTDPLEMSDAETMLKYQKIHRIIIYIKTPYGVFIFRLFFQFYFLLFF